MTEPSGAPERADASLRRISCGDVTIEVCVEGQGPPIVLLPSSGRDSLDFGDVAFGLTRHGFRVLRPQPRGMLGSRGPMHGITLHDLARDIAGVIEELGEVPAIVLGHAFGSRIARLVAADHPHLVRGIVLAAAAADRIPSRLLEIGRKVADPTLDRSERLDLLVTGFFVRRDHAEGWLTGWHPAARRAHSAADDATPANDWRQVRGCPILDLQADADPWRPRETTNEIKDFASDPVTIAVVKDASHALLPEQPERVSDHVARWATALVCPG